MKQMSIIGIGTKLAVITIGYAILIVLCQNYFSIDFTIRLLPHLVFTIVGITLLMVGVPFLLFSIIAIKKAYQKDSLCTTGIYAICRHPIYASWILCITPGITFLLESWLLLTIPLVMYLVFRILIRKEESYLQDRFGDNYIAYKTKVGLLFPVVWRNKKL